MRRREFLLQSAAAAGSLAARKARSQPKPSRVTLGKAPLEVQGEWGHSPPQDAAAVISRMREVCLDGVRLLSDRQPSGLRVENRTSGPPCIWLHDEPRRIAWIVVDIASWRQLAYQFGHELGHVLVNSWSPDSKPQLPCQWLEEALVEAFTLRGLVKLADSWEQRPLLNDASYANAIRQYPRREECEKIASNQMRDAGAAAWFREYRSALENEGGIGGPAVAAVPTMLHELETDARNVEDISALNRWPERSAVPIEQYLRLWQRSCKEIGAAGGLPKRVVELLGLPRLKR